MIWTMMFVFRLNVLSPTMGKCLHGFHDPTTQMERNGHHSHGSRLILQVGKNGPN
jgi:hypothetical protein